MGVLVEDGFTFGLVDREFYETLDRYQPKLDDFVSIATRRVDSDWECVRSGIWFHCHPHGANIPPHGWKIHVSATLETATVLLAAVSAYLGVMRVPFKFTLDRFIFRLLHGKNWTRGGSGKFITVYPQDEQQCRELLEGLYLTTVGFNGPYILSDRRYRDSTVVHYRYGGFQPTRRLTVRGDSVPVMKAPDGHFIEDERTPYFRLPEGMTDPFAQSEAEPNDTPDLTLKGGRFLIESAISFTNSGGVYSGRDRETGELVIIKEARPYASQTKEGSDAVMSLRKEHRLLKQLEETAVAPRPIDFFRDWEHYYLVEEYVQGLVLRGFNAHNSLALMVRPTRDDAQDFVARFQRLYARIAEAVQVLHERNITFSDLSHYNVIVASDGDVVKLIDFEGAYERGVDPVQVIHTPGFAPQQQIEGGSQPEDDCFAVGGLMMAGLMPINGIFALDTQGFEPFLQSCTRDLGFPEELGNCIRALLDQERTRRPRLKDVVKLLRINYEAGVPTIGTSEADGEDLPMLLHDSVQYVESTADFSRNDRLFPAASTVFHTNALSVANGACGVGYALNRIAGSVRSDIVEWILSREVSSAALAPGLYMGMAGVSWALLELGHSDRATEIARATWNHPLLRDSPDLFYGIAGCGMAQLRFFLHTGDAEYLTRALEAADHLISVRQSDAGLSWWTSDDGAVSCGLGHGGAGIALFLLYTSLASNRLEYADVGREALAYVLSKGVRTPEGGLTWRVQEGHSTTTPYWRWGSAGIGMVLLRYAVGLQTSDYDSALADIDLDCDRKYSIFPGLHLGLAGIGEFYLDLARMRGDSEALRKARKLLSGILLFKLKREAGVAFPGETRSKISCDLASGGAGIALFLHRYLHPSLTTPFMVDELIERTLPRGPAPARMIEDYRVELVASAAHGRVDTMK